MKIVSRHTSAILQRKLLVVTVKFPLLTVTLSMGWGLHKLIRCILLGKMAVRERVTTAQ